MPTIVFRFPGGCYHATPWGNHVNEGLVEWPPSPWRIVRALLATGFSKLEWREPPAAARELAEGLASVLPTYRLPPATAAHTRHYMPTDSPNPEDRTKIFDAFARVGRDAELAVLWPATLTSEADALLRELVPKISYLGRAESIVEARVADEAWVPSGLVASATETNRPGLEPIALLAPMSEKDYDAWRSETAGPETLRKRGQSQKGSAFPLDAMEALIVDSAFLQAHGWTQPPGSHRVHYYRPADALTTASPRVETVETVRRPMVEADTALLALSSDTRTREVLPLLIRALPQAELLHAGLVSQLHGATCPELTGRQDNRTRLEGHRHASIIPLCLADPRQLDHFLVHAPMGFEANAQRALRSIRCTYTKGGSSPLFLTLAGLGKRENFLRLGSAEVPELSFAKTWTSRTPFIPPRHIKKVRHSLEDQVQAELLSRGLPRALSVEILERDALVERAFHRFVRQRRNHERQPPAPCFFALRVVLERPAHGPISLGYASHFGMGLMVPDA